MGKRFTTKAMYVSYVNMNGQIKYKWLNYAKLMSFFVRRHDLSTFLWWKIQTSTSFIRCREASGTKCRELGFIGFACRSLLFSWSVK
jgi:hypothetical protein